jgi:hypothetical protein
LVVHLHSYDERKKLESSGRKGMESIEDFMDSNVEKEHEEEHEGSKKERKTRTTKLNQLLYRKS